MPRPTFLHIPCGKTLGHGERCVVGNLCSQCEYIEELEVKNKKATELATDFMNANDEGDCLIHVHRATYLCHGIIKALKGEGDEG